MSYSAAVEVEVEEEAVAWRGEIFAIDDSRRFFAGNRRGGVNELVN